MDLGTDPGAYCRDIEAYLCRKNDGHLIRIVGPAFELVSGWAARGIPLRVVFEGIDRFFERYYRKGPRRRPVHISFCDDDVQDVFDDWRRATGVPAAVDEGTSGEEAVRRPRASLTRHLERTIAAVTACRAGARPGLDASLEAIVRELDVLRGGGRPLRGGARTEAIDRLRTLDRQMASAARASIEAEELDRLTREADEALRPFRARMSDDAWAAARSAAVDRGIRAALRLPVLAFEDA